MWFRCRALGLLDENTRHEEDERGVENWFREEAEREFIFVLQDEEEGKEKIREENQVKGKVEGDEVRE